MKHLGLFEGIGGFSLAARWAGWETVCEYSLPMEKGKRDSARILLEKINDELRGETHLPTIEVKWSAYDVA